MYKLALLFTVFFALNATAKINNNTNCLNIDVNCEQYQLENLLFTSEENSTFETIDINSIEVIEIEENVGFNFNPKDYLPENFNALKGKHDLDWSTIELVELDDDVEFDFDTQDYLPNNFNTCEGMYSKNVVACLY